MDFSVNLTLLDQLYENLTYYKFNSNYKDPMFGYSDRAYNALLLALIKAIPKANFDIIDGYNAVDKSTVLEYGTIPCHATGKQAFVDSSLACFFFQLPFFLENIQFGYIGFLIVLPIMLNSIFGGIKESYRWYLFNQAIWDAFVCYDFICEKPTLLGYFSSEWENTNTCFYNFSLEKYGNVIFSLTSVIRDAIRFSAFIPIFLLAFSRFLALYFPLFYKRIFSKSWKTAAFILIFNIISIFFIRSRRIVFLFSVSNAMKNIAYCQNTFCTGYNTSMACYRENELYFRCNNQAVEIAPSWIFKIKNISNIFALTMFFAANFFAILLFAKLISQLKFQLKSKNRNSFISTAKIGCVIGFQCLTMTVIFVINIFQLNLYLKAVPNSNFIGLNYYYIYKQIPPWLFFLQHYSTTQCLNIIRVFLDSFIVLTFLSGYSSCVKKCFKFICLCFIHPKTVLKIFSKNNATSLFVLSSVKKNSLKNSIRI